MSGLWFGKPVSKMSLRRHIGNFVPWAINESAQFASQSRLTNPVGTETIESGATRRAKAVTAPQNSHKADTFQRSNARGEKAGRFPVAALLH
jgi:hypothetical protein